MEFKVGDEVCKLDGKPFKRTGAMTDFIKRIEKDSIWFECGTWSPSHKVALVSRKLEAVEL